MRLNTNGIENQVIFLSQRNWSNLLPVDPDEPMMGMHVKQLAKPLEICYVLTIFNRKQQTAASR
jgi:hypothetical protein